MNLTINKTKNYNNIFLAGIIIILAILFFAAYTTQLKREQHVAFITVNPIHTLDGWGYEILANGKTYIRQSFIPAVEGKKSFKTKEDAIAVGNKVVEKMKMGQQLPTITVDELKQLGVLRDSLPQ
jgi:isocitrate dehydrogenase